MKTSLVTVGSARLSAENTCYSAMEYHRLSSVVSSAELCVEIQEKVGTTHYTRTGKLRNEYS